VAHIWVHTTASDQQDPAATARYHISRNNHISRRGCPSICYHDTVAKDGTVSHCNDYGDVTWHTRGYNGTGVGVALAYRGQDGNPPIKTQYQAAVSHLGNLCLFTGLDPSSVRGHREAGRSIGRKGSMVYRKTCPGLGIDMNAMRRDVCIDMQTSLAMCGLYPWHLIDGRWGPRSKAAARAYALDMIATDAGGGNG
jgi:hypothetical protein